MGNLLILLLLVSETPSQDTSETSKSKFGTGMQWSLLSSIFPCVSIRYWGNENFGLQGMVTALFTEQEEGVFYAGIRGIYRVLHRLPTGEKLGPYFGLGGGYRTDSFAEEKGGIGTELFTGIEWYPFNFLSLNLDFGVRYSPTSLVGIPWRIGIGGGGIVYFF